jgi:hypothetical protein
VDETPLPNGEKSTQQIAASKLLPPPTSVFVVPAEQVEDDRIKRALAANPLSTVLKPTEFVMHEPVSNKARRAAAKRTGKMLDFCDPFRLGDQTRGTIPGTISIAGKETPINPQNLKTGKSAFQKSSSTTSKKKTKKKLSKSQLQGRARLSQERGEQFLTTTLGRSSGASPSRAAISSSSKSPSTSKTSRDSKSSCYLKSSGRSTRADFPMEKIAEWFADIPEEFRVCSLPTPAQPQLKPLTSNPKRRVTNMTELIQQDEQKYQKKYKKKKEGSIGKSKGKKHKSTLKKRPKSPNKHLPSAYFRVNNESLRPAHQTFDALSKVVVGFDTLERAGKPKRIPPRLVQFWAHHQASGVAPKILSDGFTLSEFEVSVKKLGQLEVSTEMQAMMKQHVLQPGGRGGKDKTMTDIWNDFWVDEVGSELAAPLDSSIFVQQDSNGSGIGSIDASAASLEAPRFVVDDASAAANLPHGSKRFSFAGHAHSAASRIQKIYHKRRSVRDFCSTKISACFHGFKARNKVALRKKRMQASASLIATLFRGMKARQHVDFIRTTGWNHIAILCQRCARRWLANKEVHRRRFARTYNAATDVQRIWRGIWGREAFKRWKFYVRHRSAKSIQNMVRWHNFWIAKDDYYFNLLIAVEDLQRIFRGHVARKHARKYLLRISSAQDIQRVWHGYLGRRRFGRKMSVVRSACVTIQVRVRGILARKYASEVRTTALVEERDRTEKEEAALTRRLEETRDFMVTKAGKLELKENKKKYTISKRGETAKNLLLGPRRSSLLRLKNAFELVDFRSTGLINRTQFKELMIDTLHLSMSNQHLNSAWSKTGTVVATKGGSRLSDLSDRRELEDIVAWYECGEDRKAGLKASAAKVTKRAARALSCKPGVVSRMAQKGIFLRTRLERTTIFRQDRPPAFVCLGCTKRFVFSYELERHMKKGSTLGCPGKYYCPVLDD